MIDRVNCAHSSCVANLLYKSELIIINDVYSTQCRAVNIQSGGLIETSRSRGVNCTHGSCVANLLHKFEFIVINGVYSAQCRGKITGVHCAQCRLVNIQSERPIGTSLSDGVNCTHSSCVANIIV